jgi:hypothetical protein
VLHAIPAHSAVPIDHRRKLLDKLLNNALDPVNSDPAERERNLLLICALKIMQIPRADQGHRPSE